MQKPFMIFAALAGAAGISTPAFADRPPSAKERASLERVLKTAGFINWEEIELDDDGPLWEVDDARTRDGKRFDLKIDPRTLRIVKRSRDD